MINTATFDFTLDVYDTYIEKVKQVLDVTKNFPKKCIF